MRVCTKRESVSQTLSQNTSRIHCLLPACLAAQMPVGWWGRYARCMNTSSARGGRELRPIGSPSSNTTLHTGNALDELVTVVAGVDAVDVAADAGLGLVAEGRGQLDLVGSRGVVAVQGAGRA